SILLIRVAKQQGLPVFFTYHTPTVSCQRGTMMFRGEEACDGVLNVRRCTTCYGESLGIPRWASALPTYVPLPLARSIEKANFSGGVSTAMQLSELVRRRHLAFQELVQEVDAVIALSDWVRALLLSNGVPGSKISFSRHGAPHLQDWSELP